MPSTGLASRAEPFCRLCEYALLRPSKSQEIGMPKPEETAVSSNATRWRWGMRGFYWSSILLISGFRLGVNSVPTWTPWVLGGVVALIVLLAWDKIREFIWPFVL